MQQGGALLVFARDEIRCRRAPGRPTFYQRSRAPAAAHSWCCGQPTR